jgi:hypothetical protein
MTPEVALRRLLGAISLLMALLLAGAPSAWAGPPAPMLLLPATPRAFVELAALNLNVAIQCADDACAIETEQIYHLQNRDRLKGAEIQVALQGAAGEPASVSFALAAQATALGADTWALRFGPEQTIIATVRYREPLASPAFARWQWQGAGLSVWGRPTSARIELRLPWDAPEDLILAQQPPADGFDGRVLHWEYENPTALGPFQVWLVAPTAWQQGETLRREGQLLALARFYRELGREAVRTGAPYPDTYPLALGALETAAHLDASPEPHLALADLYLERAAELPALAPNYRLLAAEELEAALQAGSPNAAISERLAELYFDLAQQAREGGSPTDALHYIGLAREHAAGGAVGDALTIEAMTLDWALDLASKGRVAEALVQAADVLSPRVQDALYRYAPPLVAARTEITLTAQARTVGYRLYLYPPLAQETLARLHELAQTLDGMASTHASLTPHGDAAAPWADLLLQVEYASLGDLAYKSQVVAQLGSAEPDLVQALIAAPWGNELAALHVFRTPWMDLYTYQERPAFERLEALRQEQAQYTTWRLVEVASGRPEVERDQLEQQLTALALREQRQIWENLSSASYWSYHVVFEEPSALPTMDWLVGWGQERELEIAHRFFWWRRIAEHAGVALGVLALAVVVVTWLRKLMRRRRARPKAG